MRELLKKRQAQANEAGLTLIELLVTMMILSGVTAAAYGVLIQVSKQSRDVQGREQTTTNARLALEQMDRQIRSGNVLYDPALETLPNSMRVYTQTNGQERCVQWQLTGGKLRSRSWSPTWQTDGLVKTWGVVARGITNTTSPFSLDSTSAYGSRLINISFTVKDSKAGGSAQTVQTSLSGRNTEYGYDTGLCNPIPAP